VSLGRRRHVYSHGNQLSVDPKTMAAHIALRPIDYSNKGRLLGDYRVAYKTSMSGAGGSVQGTVLGIANGFLSFGSARALVQPFYTVLLRVEHTAVVSTAFTTLTSAFDFSLTVIRQVTSISASGVQIVPSTKRWTTMPPASSFVYGQISAGVSSLGASGTADARAHGYSVFPTNNTISPPAINGQSLGSMYRLDQSGVQHPLVLGFLEAAQVNVLTINLSAAGVLQLYTVFEWAEVVVY